MSLYKRPLTSILEAIARLNNGVVLAEDQYLFGAPQVIAPLPDGDNTELTISEKNIQTPYEGSVTVTYRRLDLADLATMLPASIKLSGFSNTLEFATKLNQVYGFNFTADDIETSPVALVDGAGTVTLVAKATSMGWVGQVDLQVVPGRLQIADYLTVVQLGGLGYPNPSVTKPFGEMYSYYRNLTSYEPQLSAIDPQNLPGDILQQLATLLTSATGDTWYHNEVRRYSLMGATVDYNGDAVAQGLANDLYDNVMVITLHPTNCQGLSGRLFLHYNEPEDI